MTGLREEEIDRKSAEKELMRLKLKKLRELLPKSMMFYSFISNSLDDIINFEIGFNSALLELEFSDEKGYLEIEKKTWVNGLRQKFSELMFLDRLINITGNVSFRDEIMKSYVETLFTKKNTGEGNKLEKLLRTLSKGG